MATLTGAGVRALREVCGITQQQMADAVHATTRSVNYWESGTKQVPEDVSDWVLEAAAEHDMGVEGTVSRITGAVPPGKHVVLTYYRNQGQADWEAELQGEEKASPYQFLNAITRSAAEHLKSRGYAVSFAYPDEEHRYTHIVD